MIRLILIVAFVLGFVIEALAAVGSANSYHFGRALSDGFFATIFLIAAFGLVFR